MRELTVSFNEHRAMASERITFVAERLSPQLERWQIHPVMMPSAVDFGKFFYAFGERWVSDADLIYVYLRQGEDWWFKIAERVVGSNTYYRSQGDWSRPVTPGPYNGTMTVPLWDEFQQEISAHVEKVMLSE